MHIGNKVNYLSRQGALLFTLVIFCAVVLFFNLGKRSFWEPDEGRYAEISREMLESGDWLTPRLNYIKHFDKPPIAYWLIGSSFNSFGQNEFVGHLPLVLFSLIGVLATFFLGQRLFTRRCGFLAGIILISSLGYPAISRVLSTDIIFTTFCSLCYLFFVLKNYPLFYLFMALGFMTKGPVVFIITLLPITLFLIYEREIQILKRLYCHWGLLIFLMVGSPWFVYQVLQNKGLLFDWVVQQTFNRIVREIKQPFYFFIPVLIGLFFPWIFFIIPSLKENLSWQRLTLNQKPAKAMLLFFWFTLPFIFFSCIGKKLIPYILPLLPALAILVACLWDKAFENLKIVKTKSFIISFYIFLICLLIFLAAMTVFLIMDYDYRLDIQAARFNIIAMCIVLGAGAIASFIAFKANRTKRLFWIIAVTSLFFFLMTIDLLPKIEIVTGKSVKALALKIKEDLRPEDKIVNYRCFLKSLPFYLGQRTIVVERQRNIAYEGNKEDLKEFLLKDKKDLYRLLSEPKTKVYCITYTWEFEKIKKGYPQPLYLLGQAGKYELFTNKK